MVKVFATFGRIAEVNKLLPMKGYTAMERIDDTTAPVERPVTSETIDLNGQNGFASEEVQDRLAEMDDKLSCLWCLKDFRNRAGLGAHMVRIHGVKLNGEIVTEKPASRKTRKSTGPDVSLVIRDGELELAFDLHLTERDLRSFLKDHSDDLIDGLVG